MRSRVSDKKRNIIVIVSVVLCILFVGYRAIYDKNMLLNGIMGYNINFSYFADFISFMKIMIYGLVISDICFIIHEKNPKEIEIARKIEVL